MRRPLADQLGPYSEAGATRLEVSIAAGDWFRQTELIARAPAQLD